MILRYFYIDKYNEIAQNLDINLGGKYKYQYQATMNKLLFIRNEGYVANLYEEYSVISDVSAILGKNSAGKTTVLRMINSIFNGFNKYSKERYIIIFEKENNYILFTNYMHLKYDEKKLDKKIQCEKGESFNAIDILKDVGLIYFSNIFDRATPFQGNANLIDISANYMFEHFYMDNINRKLNNTGEKISILEEYKSDSNLTEIDFLLDIKRSTATDTINLLFDIPAQIELGFSQVFPDSGNNPLCDNEENNHLLKKIYKSLVDYLDENQEFEEERSSLFQKEIIFYFLFDELYRFCKEDKYNVFDALKCWMSKIENENWEISCYYQEILGALGQDHTIMDTASISNKENLDPEEETYEIGAFDDIWEDIYRLHNQLEMDSTENINYSLLLHKISKIQMMAEKEHWKNHHIIRYNLKEAEYLLQEIQDDLLSHDYDLYNITCIYEAESYIEKAINMCNMERVVSAFSDDDFDDSWLDSPNNNGEITEVKPLFDSDTEEHLTILQNIVNTLIDFTKRYEYDADANMLKVRLDSEDTMEFIRNFQKLDCKTVVLDTKRNDISSGHSAYLNMCARINSAKKSGEICRKENVILLIDEGDIYLHPEKQLAYMDNLLKLLQILYQEKKVQLIVTSNSPFIISDIQSSNILYLEREGGKINIAKSTISNTFASNVNVLLLDSFFVKNGLIGEYARKKIDRILQDIQSDNLSESEYLYLEAIIKIIGEPIIRRKLETMLFHNISTDNTQREIQYYERMLRQIKRLNK